VKSEVTIPYNKTNYFSKTALDYLSQSEQIQDFYNLFPNLANFKKQIELKNDIPKQAGVSTSGRKTLVSSLKKQYKNIATSNKTKSNIQLLLDKNTFTITTGHQLNLFTGPLYFLYKIISTINLCEELHLKYPNYNFVPIYWMATEDHDFEEIKYFNFKDKKVTWNRKSAGAVGRLSTNGLEQVFEEVKQLFGTSKNGQKLSQLFYDSYLKHNNLTDATRFLTNELFKDYGLVIIDADETELKRKFIPFIEDELINNTAFKQVSETNKIFGKDYKIQVNPREINLFYLTDELRERIIFKDGFYQVNNTDISFSWEEILIEVANHPERFSPNVIMRPLYQEVILPNLCYIGGGGELAYWLELKTYFKSIDVVFPILLLRNSALLMSKKQSKKLHKLHISKEELFLKQTDLIHKKIKEISNLNLDFSEQKQFLQEQFSKLKNLASQTDKSFIGAVKAQEKKQLNGLENLEKRLLKAEKRKLADVTNRIILIQNELFPMQSLQERYTNFSEMYLEFGEELIPLLKENLKPLDLRFSILEL
jgi:bacillithiol biosynthesis cysteine-adding enzyme BshC